MVKSLFRYTGHWTRSTATDGMHWMEKARWPEPEHAGTGGYWHHPHRVGAVLLGHRSSCPLTHPAHPEGFDPYLVPRAIFGRPSVDLASTGSYRRSCERDCHCQECPVKPYLMTARMLWALMFCAILSFQAIPTLALATSPCHFAPNEAQNLPAGRCENGWCIRQAMAGTAMCATGCVLSVATLTAIGVDPLEVRATQASLVRLDRLASGRSVHQFRLHVASLSF